MVKKILDGSIKVIMESVKLFAETITMIANIKTTTMAPDGTTVDNYICTDPDGIKRLADGIATAFVSFITIIADAFTGNSDEPDLKNVSKNI